MIGVFMALDLFLFYVMWESRCSCRCTSSSGSGAGSGALRGLKFFLYTMVGSLLMLWP
jgi:NADH-quinone oxidoreductase subunit M